jgi:hypothetical protein
VANLVSGVAGTPLCELNLPSGNFAWYDESTQQYNKSIYPWNSALYGNKIKA